MEGQPTDMKYILSIICCLWASCAMAFPPGFIGAVTHGAATAVCDDGLLSNGCFDDGATGWTATSEDATATVSDGVMAVAQNAGSYEGVKQTVTLENAASYTLVFDVIALSGNFYTFIGGTPCTTISATGTGQTATCTTATDDEIKFVGGGTGVRSCSIDNVRLTKD